MTSDYHSELLGDKFVHHLQIDFVNKETVVILSGHPQDEVTHRCVLTFRDVVLQDLYQIQPYNIFWGMEMSDDFDDFEEREKDYLLKMKNYFTPGLLERIKKDTSLKYYFIMATTGLSGFIICKNATLTER